HDESRATRAGTGGGPGASRRGGRRAARRSRADGPAPDGSRPAGRDDRALAAPAAAMSPAALHPCREGAADEILLEATTDRDQTGAGILYTGHAAAANRPIRRSWSNLAMQGTDG